jgi:NAD(P)-dependent dehydrogenase (short-subunit alcohol dehydrogenase family)
VDTGHAAPRRRRKAGRAGDRCWVVGPVGSLDQLAMDEFASAISINLVGTALALHHAMPRPRATRGRAVTSSGGGGTAPLAHYDAYAASKAGVVRLTKNVAAAGAFEVNTVAPGFVATRMHDGTLQAGPDAAGAAYYERTQAQIAAGGFPAGEAAELVAFLLGPESRGVTGRLISAQWAPWRDQALSGSTTPTPTSRAFAASTSSLWAGRVGPSHPTPPEGDDGQTDEDEDPDHLARRPASMRTARFR